MVSEIRVITNENNMENNIEFKSDIQNIPKKLVVKHHTFGNSVKSEQITKKTNISTDSQKTKNTIMVSSAPVVLNYIPANHKPRRARSTKIIYSVFEDCANLIDDDFWKATFMQAASGKFPRGIRYKDGFLIFKKSRKIQQVELPNTPPEIIPICISLFRSISGLNSQKDLDLQREEIERRMQEAPTPEITWASIRRRKSKKVLIGNYVKRISESMNLTSDQSKQLSSLITMGFILGIFDSASVIMDKGQISGIDGVVYNADTGLFVYNKNTNKSKKTSKLRYISDDIYFSPEQKLDKKNLAKFNFVTAWDNFVDSFNKSINNKSESIYSDLDESHSIEYIGDSQDTPSRNHSNGIYSEASTPGMDTPEISRTLRTPNESLQSTPTSFRPNTRKI